MPIVRKIESNKNNTNNTVSTKNVTQSEPLNSEMPSTKTNKSKMATGVADVVHALGRKMLRQRVNQTGHAVGRDSWRLGRGEEFVDKEAEQTLRNRRKHEAMRTFCTEYSINAHYNVNYNGPNGNANGGTNSVSNGNNQNIIQKKSSNMTKIVGGPTGNRASIAVQSQPVGGLSQSNNVAQPSKEYIIGDVERCQYLKQNKGELRPRKVDKIMEKSYYNLQSGGPGPGGQTGVGATNSTLVTPRNANGSIKRNSSRTANISGGTIEPEWPTTITPCSRLNVIQKQCRPEEDGMNIENYVKNLDSFIKSLNNIDSASPTPRKSGINQSMTSNPGSARRSGINQSMTSNPGSNPTSNLATPREPRRSTSKNQSNMNYEKKIGDAINGPESMIGNNNNFSISNIDSDETITRVPSDDEGTVTSASINNSQSTKYVTSYNSNDSTVNNQSNIYRIVSKDSNFGINNVGAASGPGSRLKEIKNLSSVLNSKSSQVCEHKANLNFHQNPYDMIIVDDNTSELNTAAKKEPKTTKSFKEAVSRKNSKTKPQSPPVTAPVNTNNKNQSNQNQSNSKGTNLNGKDITESIDPTKFITEDFIATSEALLHFNDFDIFAPSGNLNFHQSIENAAPGWPPESFVLEINSKHPILPKNYTALAQLYKKTDKELKTKSEKQILTVGLGPVNNTKVGSINTTNSNLNFNLNPAIWFVWDYINETIAIHMRVWDETGKEDIGIVNQDEEQLQNSDINNLNNNSSIRSCESITNMELSQDKAIREYHNSLKDEAKLAISQGKMKKYHMSEVSYVHKMGVQHRLNRNGPVFTKILVKAYNGKAHVEFYEELDQRYVKKHGKKIKAVINEDESDMDSGGGSDSDNSDSNDNSDSDDSDEEDVIIPNHVVTIPLGSTGRLAWLSNIDMNNCLEAYRYLDDQENLLSSNIMINSEEVEKSTNNLIADLAERNSSGLRRRMIFQHDSCFTTARKPMIVQSLGWINFLAYDELQRRQRADKIIDERIREAKKDKALNDSKDKIMGSVSRLRQFKRKDNVETQDNNDTTAPEPVTVDSEASKIPSFDKKTSKSNNLLIPKSLSGLKPTRSLPKIKITGSTKNSSTSDPNNTIQGSKSDSEDMIAKYQTKLECVDEQSQTNMSQMNSNRSGVTNQNSVSKKSSVHSSKHSWYSKYNAFKAECQHKVVDSGKTLINTIGTIASKSETGVHMIENGVKESYNVVNHAVHSSTEVTKEVTKKLFHHGGHTNSGQVGTVSDSERTSPNMNNTKSSEMPLAVTVSA